jgi:hypothetical protein
VAEHDLLILALKCPGCSARLQATPREVVHYCPTCRSASELWGRETRLRPILHAAGNGDLFLPFWVAPFSFQAAGVTVRTRGDLARFSGTIVGAGEVRADSPSLLFLPAFSLQAPQVVRVGRQMTLRMPLLRGASQAPERIGEVVVAESDVGRMAEAVVVSAMPEERRKSFSFLEEFCLTIGIPRLCTIPFQSRNRKCYSSELNLEF